MPIVKDDIIDDPDVGGISPSEKGAPNGVAELDAGGTVPVAQLPASIVGNLAYQGTWDASTNTPTLDNTDVGATGYVYRCNVAGSVDFGAGSITFTIGDFAVNNGTIWEKWDAGDVVQSIFGRVGIVVAAASDYDASQIDNDSGVTGTFVKDALNQLDTDIGNQVPKVLFDAYTILAADVDNTPAALALAASTMIGRKATGGIVALTAAEIRTIINVADGATAYTDTDARGAIGNIFGSDGKADSDIDLDNHILNNVKKVLITGSVEQGAAGQEMDVVEYVGDAAATHILTKLLGIIPTSQDYMEVMGGEDGSGQFGKGFIVRHHKATAKYSIYYSTSGAFDGTEVELFELDSSGNLTITGNIIFPDPGTNANSKILRMIADNSGTPQIGEIVVAYGTNPYIRFSPPNASGTATATIDLRSDLVSFPNDNTVDIGASGSGRPKDMYLAGDLHIGGIVEGDVAADAGMEAGAGYDVYVKIGDKVGGNYFEVRDSDGTVLFTVDSIGNVTLVSGTSINEFSTDGTLAGDSDNAVPTEKAVKTYVNNVTGGIIQADVNLAGATPVDADVSGWPDGGKGHGIGTDSSEWYMIKRGTTVKAVEMS